MCPLYHVTLQTRPLWNPTEQAVAMGTVPAYVPKHNPNVSPFEATFLFYDVVPAIR